MPIQTPIVLTLPGLVSTPPPIHMDALETISAYTADGEGEEVEVDDVADVLVRCEHPTRSFSTHHSPFVGNISISE